LRESNNSIAQFIGLVKNNKWQSLKPKRGKGAALAFKRLNFICHWDFGILNLLGPALSLSKGDYKKLEVKYKDNT